MREINIRQRLGWKRQPKDERDYKFTALHAAPNTLPPRLDLRSLCPPVYDQLIIGSCQSQSGKFSYEFDHLKQFGIRFIPSALYIYYNARDTEGTVSQDAGATLRDTFKVIATLGVCAEATWKYDIKKFTKKPPKKAYAEGLGHKAINYSAVGQTATELMGCLADGFPVIFGFEVFASFESDAVAKTGIVPMPKRGEENLGGHAVAIVGYDTEKKIFICRNSWGAEWGDKGYFYMPFDYVLSAKLASDFWTVRLVA